MDTETKTPVAIKLDWEVAPKPLGEINEGLRQRVAELQEQANIQAVRHQMAQAFTQMQMKGYNALLNYGVNFQSLPAYKDPDGLLDAAAEMPLLEGQEKYMEYMRRVEHDIDAAVRRKQFGLVKH